MLFIPGMYKWFNIGKYKIMLFYSNKLKNKTPIFYFIIDSK